MRPQSNDSYLFLSGSYCGEDEFVSQNNKKGMNYTLFKACRQFYKVYPQIGSTVSNEFVTDPDVLVNNLSFSHIREIMVLNDVFERFFYETECMKCNWNG